jgi:hypothetical protein
LAGIDDHRSLDSAQIRWSEPANKGVFSMPGYPNRYRDAASPARQGEAMFDI